MSSQPPGLPEPISPRSRETARGRDRTLSAPDKSARRSPPPPYEYAPAAAPGASSSALPAPASTLLQHGPRLHTHHLSWFLVLGLLGMALAITIPFILGVYTGNREREQFLERQAQEHFQRALAYESETYTELAIAELNVALQYKPDYSPARDKLEQLKTINLAKNAEEPQDLTIANQLYQSAQAAFARGAWDDAVDLFEELRRVKSDYRAAEVTSQLVTAYVNAGQAALASGDVDLARRRFEAALLLAPDNAQARTFSDRAALYFSGSGAMGSDWPAAVLALSELYQRDPTFADVKTKLRDAHLGYGEFANHQGAYCIAARELDAAIALGAGPTIETAAALANANCKEAIVNPTPSATPTPVGGIPVFDGTLTPAPGTPAAVTTGLLYTPRARVRQYAACNGTGDIKGAVMDAGSNPLPNVGVKMYNDFGYFPPLARTDAAGEYTFGLGTDNGIFHLVIVDDFGSNVSPVLDVDYPGGNVQGCHIVVEWIRTR